MTKPTIPPTVSSSPEPSAALPPGAEPAGLLRTVARGLRTRCPRCGRGALFSRRLHLRERCETCGLVFAPYAHDTWAMTYLSTAGLTGLVVIGLIVSRPANRMLGRFTLAAVALTVIVVSLPFRKGAAIAVNWLIAVRSGDDDRVSSSGDRC